MLKEVCVENFTKVPEAIEKGARRVELCDNLAVGGTTVSPGVARVTLDYCRSRNVKVMSMIRPRGGDFVYNVDEIEIMKQQRKCCSRKYWLGKQILKHGKMS